MKKLFFICATTIRTRSRDCILACGKRIKRGRVDFAVIDSLTLAAQILFFFLFIFSNSTYAINLSNWFSTPDQRAYKLMQKGQIQAAEKEFENQDWRGVASYRASNYGAAEKAFAALNSAEGYYNQGNALALSGKYEDAISAYNKALALNPKNKDAEFNRDLLKKLQKQKKQQNQSNSQKNKEQQKSNNKDSSKPQSQPEKKQEQNAKPKEKPSDSEQKQNDPEKQKSEQQAKKDVKKSTQNQNKEQPNTMQSQEQKTAAREQERAKEQWLKLIPDDPGGLLREKFWRDHLRRQEGWNL